MEAGAIGNSNWATLKAVIGAGQKKDVHHKGSMPPAATDAKRPQPLGPNFEPTEVLAIDCEMVGVGPDGVRSSLARSASLAARLHARLSSPLAELFRQTNELPRPLHARLPRSGSALQGVHRE